MGLCGVLGPAGVVVAAVSAFSVLEDGPFLPNAGSNAPTTPPRTSPKIMFAMSPPTRSIIVNWLGAVNDFTVSGTALMMRVTVGTNNTAQVTAPAANPRPSPLPVSLALRADDPLAIAPKIAPIIKPVNTRTLHPSIRG